MGIDTLPDITLVIPKFWELSVLTTIEVPTFKIVVLILKCKSRDRQWALVAEVIGIESRPRLTPQTASQSGTCTAVGPI